MTGAEESSTSQGLDDLERANRLGQAAGRIREELGRAIVGQDEVIELCLTALFSGGHCLLVGVPGLAKTLLVSSLSRTLGLSFSRIQFTPDLMPADITGTEVLQENRTTGEREFHFLPGPVFANVILADEINRTPPKTQAALLEAMQEAQVTAGGEKHTLDQPFLVLATQNPIEQEGTYPLPEAQLDRFQFMIRVDYPESGEERQILERTTVEQSVEIEKVVTGEEILEFQQTVRRVPIAPDVMDYAIRLVRATRTRGDHTPPEFVAQSVSWGAGPRAGQFLVLGGKARALLHGNRHVSIEDIQAMALPVLRHRIVTNFAAEAEGVDSDEIIRRLLDTVPTHPSDRLDDDKLPSVVGS